MSLPRRFLRIPYWQMLGEVLMRPLVKSTLILIAVLVLAACVSGPKPDSSALLPMYGGMDRQANPKLRAADDKFITRAVNDYGDRQRASQAMVEKGIRNFLVRKNVLTMENFNHAWLLDPRNPDAFWGFAMVYADQGKYCSARAMIDKALERGLTKPAYLADSGRIYTLCAVSDNTLTAVQRRAAFDKSEELFSRAASLAPREEYIYGSWAAVLYRQDNYADAWRMVKKQRALGGIPDASFLSLLRARMVEPK